MSPYLLSERNHLRLSFEGGKLYIACIADRKSADGKAGLAAIASIQRLLQTIGVPHETYECKDPSDPRRRIPDTIILHFQGQHSGVQR